MKTVTYGKNHKKSPEHTTRRSLIMTTKTIYQSKGKGRGKRPKIIPVNYMHEWREPA